MLFPFHKRRPPFPYHAPPGHPHHQAAMAEYRKAERAWHADHRSYSRWHMTAPVIAVTLAAMGGVALLMLGVL